ncbi:entry exclusion protein TrbK (plasmid) [Rhizobium ruizarguesonis]|uniref:entry exclusion protein TrbK n=1 Tax=Rhizobium/Agrobacterium group TaxID=227290 RepID=UPI00102FA516|nr:MULTISPECIES: entry exclusion protein TrbK [Rhizobium]NKK81288.1 entry exclusion protein TrbK [Rhizobium leguminosarum bv. viciae]NTZ63552.1 entry exclusion protein TrbK [Agrobacterium tumefaciens]TAW83778.1 entry exclusion protein TrbK [Rhizobium ruizarguesonis]
MSPRLIVIIALVAVVSAAGASAITSSLFRPESVLGSGAIATGSPSDEDRRRHREEFFSGDANRDIRGGQEMKPRW